MKCMYEAIAKQKAHKYRSKQGPGSMSKTELTDIRANISNAVHVRYKIYAGIRKLVPRLQDGGVVHNLSRNTSNKTVRIADAWAAE